MFPYKFGFIGAGNMGFAIMKGLVQSFQPEDIIFYEKNEQRAEDVVAAIGAKKADSGFACADSSWFVVLAVKPQQLGAAVKEIRNGITGKQVFVPFEGKPAPLYLRLGIVEGKCD